MKSIYVNQLNEHISKEINDEFVLQKINIRTNSNGSIRYDCILSDNSGSVNAVIWNEAITDDYIRYKSSVVKITGLVEIYNGNLSIQISKLELVGLANMEEFWFNLDDDVYETYITRLNGIISDITDPNLKGLCSSVFSVKMCSNLKNVPATLNRYYSFNGGLFSFILDKVETVKSLINNYSNNSLYKNVDINTDVLITAALLQDIGTIYIYYPFPVGKLTERGLLNDSTTESINYVSKAIQCVRKTYDIEESTVNLLLHLISLKTNNNFSKKTLEGIILNESRSIVKELNIFHTEFTKYDEIHPMSKEKSIYSDYFDNYIVRNLLIGIDITCLFLKTGGLNEIIRQ